MLISKYLSYEFTYTTTVETLCFYHKNALTVSNAFPICTVSVNDEHYTTMKYCSNNTKDSGQ